MKVCSPRTSNEKGVLAYDFGVHYKTGYESLTFAIAARNFALKSPM